MNSFRSVYRLIEAREEELANRKLEKTWNNVWLGAGKVSYENLRLFKTSDKIDVLCKMGVDFYGKDVIDIGCGNGATLMYLNKNFDIKSGLGVDISPEAIEKLKGEDVSETLDFIVGDHRDLKNVKNDYFDIALSWGVIEHFEEYLLAASEARRVLKKGGFFVLIQPHLFSFGTLQRMFLELTGKWRFGDQKDFSYKYYEKILRRLGFEEISCFTMPPYPDMKVTRIFDKFVKKYIYKKWGHYLYIIAKK